MKYLYHSYQDAIDIFTELSSQYPQFIKTETIGETWEKRPILLVTVSADIDSADEKPALFYTGTIHAREYIGIELAIAFARHVAEGMAFDPRIQESFQRSTIYMVPCANPDGLEYSRNHFSFWRKNRRKNADGSMGVDLNRNFPIGFKKNNNPSSNVYSGPEPFSEPETRALKEFVESRDNITIALDYHSQGNVFFPAHDFRHENTVDTTDMNVLCANMAEQIRRVSGREYGIHQGKPPATLISGSGREFYYSKGIIGSVVEVGTQNISDYLNTMAEHIREHIPALLAALKEVPHYAKDNPLCRPEGFQLQTVEARQLELCWDYPEASDEVYFEIFRSRKYKSECSRNTLIAVTKSHSYCDENLESACLYYYRIRAANRSTGQKSPFAPLIRVMTSPDRAEMAKTLYPIAAETGYLGEKIDNNRAHFGYNSLFVGINKTKGECIALLTFPLSTMPDNAIIKSASLALYPFNRVSATIDRYGEWNLYLVDLDGISDIYDFDAVKAAPRITSIGRPTKSQQLTQGIWRNFKMSLQECLRFQQENEKAQKVGFLLEGPSSLLPWRDSQMMQWDIGYGKFGYGLEFRPYMEIVYSQPTAEMNLPAVKTRTLSQEKTLPAKLMAGFEDNGNPVTGLFNFSLQGLPDSLHNVIESAHLKLPHDRVVNPNRDLRFHVEMIEPLAEDSYEAFIERQSIQAIGVEISANELKRSSTAQFPFDSHALQKLEEAWQAGRPVEFAIICTSAKRHVADDVIEWSSSPEERPKLVLNLLSRRREAVAQVTDFDVKLSGDQINLTWKNPVDPDFRGVIVVRNSFRVPQSPFDGQKLYGGQDNYTTDAFGADDVEKYYAVFTYDHVPNYSVPVSMHYLKESSL